MKRIAVIFALLLSACQTGSRSQASLLGTARLASR
jgi:CHAT domain-containing protein